MYPNGEMTCHYYSIEYISGPQIKTAIIDNEDITVTVKKLYGETCNWCGKLFTAKALGNEDYIGKTLYIEYIRTDMKHRTCSSVDLTTVNTVINHPLWTPFSIIERNYNN